MDLISSVKIQIIGDKVYLRYYKAIIKGDEIQSRLPFKIFSTLQGRNF